MMNDNKKAFSLPQKRQATPSLSHFVIYTINQISSQQWRSENLTETLNFLPFLEKNSSTHDENLFLSQKK